MAKHGEAPREKRIADSPEALRALKKHFKLVIPSNVERLNADLVAPTAT